MSQQLKMILMIWKQVWFMRINVANPLSLYIYSALLPIGGLLIGCLVFLTGHANQKSAWIIPKFSLIGVGATLVIIAYVAYFMLAQLITRQFLPSHAKLIPNFKMHLQAALALPLCVIPLLFLLVQSGIAQEFKIEWFVISTAVMITAILGIRSPWSIALMILSVQLPDLSMKTPYVQTLLNSMSIKLVTLPLCWMLALWCLHWAFSMKEKQHFELEKRMLSFKGWVNFDAQTTSPLWSFFQSPYLVWMDWQVKRSLKKTSSSPAINLQGFALPPALHWITNVYAMIGMGFVLFVFFTLLDMLNGSSKKIDFDFLIALSLILIPVGQISYLYNFLTGVFTSRKEQAVLFLTPIAISTEQQTRNLIRYFLRQFFIMWSLGLALILLLGIACDLSLNKLSMTIFAQVCSLPLSLLILSPHQKRVGLNDHKLLAMTVVLLVGFASLGLLPLASDGGAIALLVFGVSILIMCSYFFKIKWEEMKDAKHIFPSGRAV
jgi:hypothetical protein